MTATDQIDARERQARNRPRDYWETKSVRYDHLHDRLRRITDLLIAMRPQSVFDVGCSTGQVARRILAALPQIDYCGCDVSETALGAGGRLNVVQCDLNAEAMPFADRRFDSIVASGICEYVVDLGGFLRDLAQRLTPTGVLFVSYVNVDSLGRHWRRWLGKRPHANPTWRPLVSVAAFEALLRQSGLHIERRLETTGRIAGNSPWRDRLSPSRLICRCVPRLMPLLAAQMIYVCRLEPTCCPQPLPERNRSAA